MASVVLVTDATSFISSHVIKQLQEEGYQIRATVTSLQEDDEKVKALYTLCEEPKFKVEVVEADPAKADAWESTMKDVQYVIHAIKPVAAPAPAQEGEAPPQPAVEAVQNIFKACVSAKSVKRIVLTSSYQAISVAPTTATDKVFTEADWAEAESADPLVKSLILAEKAAWDFIKELPDSDKIDLCVMNPTMPLGPPLVDAQQDVVKMVLDRGIQGCPKVCYSVVDVRDVASAHVKALTLDTAAGNRHILHGSNLWMKDIALALSKEFKPQGYNIHTMSLPNVAVWGLSLFNKNAKTFLPIVGKQSQFDNTRMKDVLGITPRDVKETVVEEANVLIEKGLVKKPKPKKTRKDGASAAADGDAKEEEAADGEEKGEEKGDGEGKEASKENGDVKEEEGKKEEEKKEEGGKEDAAAAQGEKDGAAADGTETKEEK